MKPFLSVWCSCLVMVLVSSCASPKPGQLETESGRLPINVLANLPRGISLEELTNTTGIKPQHQFTARIESDDFLCVKLSFERPRGRFYFLFHNGELSSVQNHPKIEFVMKTNHGVRVHTPLPVPSEDRMNKFLAGSDLSSEEIVERLELLSWGEAETAKGEEPNILPGVIIMAPFWLAQIPKKNRAISEAIMLAEKFDPFKIKLGMATNETQSVFGEPELRIKESDNRMVHVYGAKLSPFAPAITPSVWVSVVFSDGKVIRVFSHDFFDKRLVNGVP